MMQRVSSAFVGRAVELSALHSAYQDSAVQTVLVAGPAGIGKSRLIAEFTARLDPQTVVLVGRCPEFGNDGMPFAPFITIMKALLRRHAAAHQAEVLLAPRPALGRWLPELAARADAVEQESDPIELFGEILTLLEQLAMAQPVVVVLEDLHWADDSSQKLLAFLVANLAERDVLLIGTYRPGGAGPLRNLVAELQRHSGTRLIAPQPLTRHEVGRQLAALLGKEPEPGVIARVFQHSGGNPLFVEALSQSPDPDSERAPVELSELLLVGVSALPAETRAILRLAAVAGSPAEHALLEAAAEVPEAILHEALRQLVDQQLLSATDTAYAFRHILIRQAIYGDLLPIERSRLHARLARVLSAQPDLLPRERHSAELAYHAFAARDVPRAAQASWQAAAIADRTSAQPERLHHLERLLELWDRVPDAAERLHVDRLTVLEHTVDAAYHCGAIERGIQAAGEALALVDEAVEPLRAAHVSYQRARLKNQRSGGGRDDLLHALELLPAEPPTLLRGQVLAELAVTLVFTTDVAGAQEHARAAAEVAERLGVPSLAARAYAHLGLATTAADPAAAIEHFARAHRAAAADARTLLTIAVWESAVLVAAGDYLMAIETIQQGLRAAHETFRFLEEGPILIVKWTQALTALGRWQEALSIIDEALIEQLPALATAALLIGHARILLAQGHLTTAQTRLDTADKLLGDAPWARQYQLELRTVQCRLALQRGEAQLAADILAETLSADDLSRHPHEAWPVLVVGTQVLVACQPPEIGTAVGPAARMTALAASLPSVSAVDAAQQAVVAATNTRDPFSWDAAVRSWRSLGQPYEQSSSLVEAARAHLAVGNRTAAQAALQAALGLAEELGAAPLIETVEQLAARARLSIVRPSVTGVAEKLQTPDPDRFGLTRRELDVLRLVTRGLSNRQIAAELFISGNTAGVHVSRILSKLGAASRTQAAAIAHRHNLGDGNDSCVLGYL